MATPYNDDQTRTRGGRVVCGGLRARERKKNAISQDQTGDQDSTQLNAQGLDSHAKGNLSIGFLHTVVL